MSRYIALLRGINVSGQRSIKMEDLRSSLSILADLDNVRTYLQSGNVIFDSAIENIKEMERLISEQIKQNFGHDVTVIILSHESLRLASSNNPFLSEEAKSKLFFHITFLSDTPQSSNIEDIEKRKQENEEAIIVNNIIYLYCPIGYGRTKLSNNFWESKLKIATTTRNWKTVTELLKLADKK